MLERVRRAFKGPPGTLDERTESLRGEAVLHGWVLHMVGLSALLLRRLLVGDVPASGWWDFAIVVQAGYWTTAVTFAVTSRWSLHAGGPLGFSVLGTCATGVLAWVRGSADLWHCILEGLFSAPLWYVAGLGIVLGIKRWIATDERIEFARRAAAVVGESILASGVLGSLVVRLLLGRTEGCTDLALLWFVPAALGGLLYWTWGGYSTEAHNSALRSAPRGLLACSLFWLLAEYLIHRDWGKAGWTAVMMAIGAWFALWIIRPRERQTERGEP